MKKTALIFIALTISICAQGISRLENSRYPSSTQPDTLYKIIDSDYDQAQLLTIGTLQGLLAQTKPEIYRVNADSYDLWLTDIKNNYGVTVITDFDKSFSGIVDKFKDSVKGYIICTLNDNSVNAAISLCGISKSIAVTAENAAILDSLGIPKYMDVRGKDEFWFYNSYSSKINKKIFCFQSEEKSSFLADYAVFGNMMTLYNSSFISYMIRIFSSFTSNAAFVGWGPDEHGSVDFSSKYNVFIHAADWANNLSTLTNFNVEEFKQPRPALHKPDKKNVHTVCYLMTDGDNIQWTLGDFMTSSKWYGSILRGKTNVGWTVSPALSEMAPTVMNLFYKDAAATSKGYDNFVAGPSGLGYIFPDKYKDLNGYAALTNAYMKKADLKILNILGDNDADAYLTPFMTQPDIDAIFYYFYSDYSGGKGKIKWVNNKPVIYGRANLWDLFESSSSLAAKINGLSTDITSSEGYSLIPVHVWSKTMADVMDCTTRFDSDVQVVTPEEFAALIKKNVMPRKEFISFAADNSETEQKYLLPAYSGTGSDSTRWANVDDKIIYHFDLEDLAGLCGSQSITLSFNVSHEYVVSVADSLDGFTVYAAWSADTSVAAETGANKAQYTIDVEEYINKGWKNFYLAFEDGKKSDAYGPVVYNITVKAPEAIGTEDDPQGSEIPEGFSLKQNYPNPFNPETLIEYNLKSAGSVQLCVFDSLGRLVKTLVNDFQTQGTHTITWDGSNNAGEKVTSGVYLYKLSSGGFSAAKKMVMLR